MEGVAQLKYLGRPLYQYNDDWLAIRQIIRRAQKVWGWKGNILQWEGASDHVSEMLLGGGASGFDVRLRVVVHVRVDGEGGGGIPCNHPKADHEEEGV